MEEICENSEEDSNMWLCFLSAIFIFCLMAKSSGVLAIYFLMDLSDSVLPPRSHMILWPKKQQLQKSDKPEFTSPILLLCDFDSITYPFQVAASLKIILEFVKGLVRRLKRICVKWETQSRHLRHFFFPLVISWKTTHYAWFRSTVFKL